MGVALGARLDGVGFVHQEDTGSVATQILRCFARHDLEIAAFEQAMRECVSVGAVAPRLRPDNRLRW